MAPHLAFPITLNQKSRTQWNPARVDAIEDQVVYLVVGQHDPKTGQTVYGQFELPIVQFDKASLDEKSDRIVPGQLLELGFYGDNGEMYIRTHPNTPYTDPDLPFFDPPNPRRYLQQPLVSP
jgi:hypothetical protein